MECQKKVSCGLSNNCKYFTVASAFGKDSSPADMIESVGQYLDCLKSKGLQSGYTRFYRDHFNADYLITPSIYRPIKGRGPEVLYVEYEHLLYREMLSRHPEEFRQCKTTVERLTIMQHYDLPTRLLDVSENPLVALYFACKSQREQKKMFLVC